MCVHFSRLTSAEPNRGPLAALCETFRLCDVSFAQLCLQSTRFAGVNTVTSAVGCQGGLVHVACDRRLRLLRLRSMQLLILDICSDDPSSSEILHCRHQRAGLD